MLRNKQKPVMWHVRQVIALDSDTQDHKKAILIAQAIVLIVCFPFTVVYYYRFGDVETAEKYRSEIKEGYGFETTPPEEALVYDQMCLELGQNKESGEYQDLIDTIAGLTRDYDDVRLGTQWSEIYSFNGSLLLFLCFNAVLAGLGSRYFYPRLIALLLNLFFTLVHFCCIITTAVYRWRSLGKLCALSIQPTKHEDVEWTYSTDAGAISALWTLQFLLWIPLSASGIVPVLRLDWRKLWQRIVRFCCRRGAAPVANDASIDDQEKSQVQLKENQAELNEIEEVPNAAQDSPAPFVLQNGQELESARSNNPNEQVVEREEPATPHPLSPIGSERVQIEFAQPGRTSLPVTNEEENQAEAVTGVVQREEDVLEAPQVIEETTQQ